MMTLRHTTAAEVGHQQREKERERERERERENVNEKERNPNEQRERQECFPRWDSTLQLLVF